MKRYIIKSPEQEDKTKVGTFVELIGGFLVLEALIMGKGSLISQWCPHGSTRFSTFLLTMLLTHNKKVLLGALTQCLRTCDT